MCGIILEYGIKTDIKPLLDEMEHRGKDLVTVDEYSNCTVGYRRLAITDEYKDTGVYLNGEIYNYKELGYIGSETEVIRQGLEAEGLDFVKRLNGMFLIVAILDAGIFVFRDRYGIKPCYVFKTDTVTIISSEIKPILKHPYYKYELNESAVEQWLTFNNYLTNETLFEGVNRLDKGTIYNVAEDKSIKFWEWNFKPQHVDYKEAVKKVRELVIQAIKRQTPLVEYGTCLSGGVDSNIILSVLGDVKTFTAGFPENNETELAKLTSKQYHEVYFDKVEYLKETVYHLEDLRVGASWSNYGLYKLAAEHIKVLFDGAGADELFGGYTWRYTGDYYSQLNRTNKQSNYCESLYKGLAIESIEDRFKFDAEIFLEGVLSVADRLSMAHTIEIRVPFLDNDLVDYCLTLPNEYKQDKKILKDAFPELPIEILTAKKQGFSSPDWFEGGGNKANKWANTALNIWLDIYNA